MTINEGDRVRTLLLSATRYDIGIGGSGEYEYLDVDTDPEGEWVKYEDIAAIIAAMEVP